MKDVCPSFKLIQTLTQSIVYAIQSVYRNAYRHPLSRFPGPWTASFSNLSHSRRFMSGRQPYEMLKLHEKYGLLLPPSSILLLLLSLKKKKKRREATRDILTCPTHETGPVVRIAPNELSFNTARSWHDIYGPRKNHDVFIKSDFYDGGNFAAESLSIVSERNPQKHGQMRKSLASAFSERSLREQEYLVAEIVDQFIGKIDPERNGGEGEVDLVNMFNLTTFDIIGSLAFGESFGGLAAGSCMSSSLIGYRLGSCDGHFRQRTPMGFCRGQQSGQRGACGHFQEIHVALGGLADDLCVIYQKVVGGYEEA